MIRKSLKATKLLFRHQMLSYLPALTMKLIELSYTMIIIAVLIFGQKNIKYLFILSEKSVIIPVMNNFIKTLKFLIYSMKL